jgi:ribosomal protein S18 acetylase RimI-like enzyme
MDSARPRAMQPSMAAPIMTTPIIRSSGELSSDEAPITDSELTALLTEAYVGGGFTDSAIAARLFAAEAVRARGELLHARGEDGTLAGMVVLVSPSSPAAIFAQPNEAELHLLAVSVTARRTGLGRSLLRAAIARAKAGGYERLLLWTQPNMVAARALYLSLGFEARPERDFERGGRQFLFHELEL